MLLLYNILNSFLYSCFLLLELQVCTRNGEEEFTAVKPEQYFENYQLDTALIEESMN